MLLCSFGLTICERRHLLVHVWDCQLRVDQRCRHSGPFLQSDSTKVRQLTRIPPSLPLQPWLQAVAVAGRAATTTALTNLIEAHGETCTYPEHALATCEAADPCAFSCSDGFVATPTDCACPDGMYVCDGACQSQACPSAAAVPRRRSAVARRGALCARGLTACGIYARRGMTSTPWECLDVARDLESCE